ncbi:MAG: glutathione S-transferase family protein [Deltaproteobacteria bacterium]|nr:glutathione S-transferase family protein [Deltaproteobacteria bacterium]
MASSKAPPFTLYEYRASPFCVAVRIALNECEQNFTPREVDPQKPRTAAFLRRSPFGRLPALVEHRPSGELSIFESPSILLFLAERFENSNLSFSDLSSKAQALSWLNFLSSGFGELLWRVLTESHIYEGEDGRPKILQTFHEELERQLGVLDKHLARRAFLAGDYSVADTLATPLLDLLPKVKDLDMDAYPHVISWRDRLRSRPSYKAAWPQEKTEK